MALCLMKLTADNVQAACRIEVKHEQQRFVESIAGDQAEPGGIGQSLEDVREVGRLTCG